MGMENSTCHAGAQRSADSIWTTPGTGHDHAFHLRSERWVLTRTCESAVCVKTAAA